MQTSQITPQLVQVTNDRANKVRPLIDHLNEVFSKAMCNSSQQSIDGHMIKFKGKPGMKQYIKSKPIKWGCKFWFRCDVLSGNLYELDMYLGHKQDTEYNLRESVVLQVVTSLKDTHGTLYFEKFISSPSLVKLLLEKNIYSIGRSN